MKEYLLARLLLLPRKNMNEFFKMYKSVVLENEAFWISAAIASSFSSYSHPSLFAVHRTQLPDSL